MNRLLVVVFGPELYWIVLYLAFRWLGARNVPPTASGNAALNWTVWLTTLIGVPLSFVALAVPGANRWVVLVRLAVAGFVGLNACAIVACDSIKYPEAGRDSGLLGLWMLSVMAGAVVWVLTAVVAVFVLRGRMKGG
jgi:hypothetical protein